MAKMPLNSLTPFLFGQGINYDQGAEGNADFIRVSLADRQGAAEPERTFSNVGHMSGSVPLDLMVPDGQGGAGRVLVA